MSWRTAPRRVLGIYTNLITRTLRPADHGGRQGRRAGAVILGGPESANYADEYLALWRRCRRASARARLTLDEFMRALPARGAHALGAVRGIVFRDDRGLARAHAAAGSGSPIWTRPAAAGSGRASTSDRYVERLARAPRHGQRQPASPRAAARTRCNWCSHAVYGYSHRRRSPAARGRGSRARSWSATHPTSSGTRTMSSPSVIPGCSALRAELSGAACTCRSRPSRAPIACRPRPRPDARPSWAATASGSARRAAASASWMPCSATSPSRRCTAPRSSRASSASRSACSSCGATRAKRSRTSRRPSTRAPDQSGYLPHHRLLSHQGHPLLRPAARSRRLPLPWEEASDRDYLIEGRQGRDYFRLADQWLRSAVEASRIAPATRRARPTLN